MSDQASPMRPFLRLYGLLNGTVGFLRYIRINHVPLNWVVAICFVVVPGVILAFPLIDGGGAGAQPLIDTWDDVLDIAMLLGISALMLLPAVWGYTAFAAAEPVSTPAPVSVLPLEVRATGTFRSAKGEAHLQIRVHAWLVDRDDAETPFVIHSSFSAPGSPEGLPCQIRLGRGLMAEWGYDYTFARPRPAIRIYGPGMKALLMLDDAETAAGVAALLQRNLG